MEHIKKYWGFYLIILAIFFYLAYKKNWFGLGSIKLIGSSAVKASSVGSNPNPADCGGSTGKTINPKSYNETLACTAPLYATGKIALQSGTKQVNERCFSISDFKGALTEADMSSGTSIRLPYPYNNTLWSYNRQMGNKYCFVDNTDFPCDKFNCTPQ